MSYNTAILGLLAIAGIPLVGDKLPLGGTGITKVFARELQALGYRHLVAPIDVWVAPLRQPNPKRHRRSTHRLMARCACGKVLSAGRLHQHVCPVAEGVTPFTVRLAEILTRYLGWEVLPATLDHYPDPAVRGVHAVRVADPLEGTSEYLVDTRRLTVDDMVDEVEFTQWPPSRAGR